MATIQSKQTRVFEAISHGVAEMATGEVCHFLRPSDTDPWWNLAAQNQATNRTHRIGQDKEVSVFKLIAKDTVEEKIVALQEAKQDLADSVLSGEAAGSASITRDDLLALLDQG